MNTPHWKTLCTCRLIVGDSDDCPVHIGDRYADIQHTARQLKAEIRRERARLIGRVLLMCACWLAAVAVLGVVLLAVTP